MRLLVTADIHYNNPRSRRLADPLIDDINRADPDVLLLLGDTAIADGDHLERCLARFTFAGPKLLVAGNHDLWTASEDSRPALTRLATRAQNLGFTLLEESPVTLGDIAFVGSVGWYDYAFAVPELAIPTRFYAAKVAPGAAHLSAQLASLDLDAPDVTPQSRELFARWNDGTHVKLHEPDAAYLDRTIARLQSQLRATSAPRVVAAIHHVPHPALLPPRRRGLPSWDFARAFLGSPRLADAVLPDPRVTHLLCGHSHFPAEAFIPRDHAPAVHALNIGSGYRQKVHRLIDL